MIDYTRKNFWEDGKLYDLIFMANGDVPVSILKAALKPKGICVLAGGGGMSVLQLLVGALQGWWIEKTEQKKISSFMARIKPEDLAFMQDLLATGKVRPVIDRTYTLDKTAEALRYIGEGHAQGKIVIMVTDAQQS